MNGAVGKIELAIYPKCGWHEYPQRPPNDHCIVIKPEPGCGILPAGVSPCDMSPEDLPFRVEAGETYGEWHRQADTNCEYEELSCKTL